MLKRLHFWAVITAFAGMVTLASLALKFSFYTIYGAACAVTIAGFILVATLQKQKALIERGGQALGQFMRGQWGARLAPDTHDDEFSRMQHRINNLLDALDLHLRGADANIDAANHADYIEKLRFTALYESLTQQKSLEAIKADRTPTESVGALLTQLGHNVADLFKSEEVKEAPTTAKSDLSALHAVADRLQAATNQLAERAMKKPVPTVAISPTSLDQLMAKIAEQASVISLNVAIEAARAPDGSTLNDMGHELHAIATQLHKARADMAALLATAVPVTDTAPSVPLSFAVDALTTAEAALREQLGDAPAPLVLEEAA